MKRGCSEGSHCSCCFAHKLGSLHLSVIWVHLPVQNSCDWLLSPSTDYRCICCNWALSWCTINRCVYFDNQPALEILQLVILISSSIRNCDDVSKHVDCQSQQRNSTEWPPFRGNSHVNYFVTCITSKWLSCPCTVFVHADLKQSVPECNSYWDTTLRLGMVLFTLYISADLC